jgi:uncharacterized protein YlxW (UPF0749 family)
MRRPISQLSLFAVALVVGLLLIGQLRSQARPTEIRTLSAQELSQLVDTLSARNVELRSALTNVREQLRDYRVAQAQGQSLLQVTTEDLRRITAFAGLAPVEGQGIVVEVSGSLDAIALNDLLNELRNAGAEALAVDDVRVTARSVAVQGPRTLLLDGASIGESFTIRAIGSPEGLAAAMERPGGILAQLEQFINATITVRESQALRLEATDLDLTPSVARPAE